MKKNNKIYATLFSLFVFFATTSSAAYAQNGQIEQVKNKVIKAIQAVSGPLGFVFIFGGVVLIALKLMVQHNNPNKRSETIAGLPWLAGAAIILGSSMIIANILFSLGQ